MPFSLPMPKSPRHVRFLCSRKTYLDAGSAQPHEELRRCQSRADARDVECLVWTPSQGRRSINIYSVHTPPICEIRYFSCSTRGKHMKSHVPRTLTLLMRMVGLSHARRVSPSEHRSCLYLRTVAASTANIPCKSDIGAMENFPHRKASCEEGSK